MYATIDLLNKAKSLIPSDAEWCRKLGISRTTLAVARVRGRLTPTVAGAMAQAISEDPQLWIAVAALEAAPEGHLNQQLWNALHTGAKSLLYLIQQWSKYWPSRAIFFIKGIGV